MTNDLGIIVGSGFDSLGLSVRSRSPIKTPYGLPSSPILKVVIGASESVPCIARHGEHYSIPPHAINYRANIWSLHQSGVRRLIAVNTVGAINPAFQPGTLIIPEQLIDYTWGREHTFFDGEDGKFNHIDFSEPFDPEIRGCLAQAIHDTGGTARAGVYGVTQGPRLETAAEIDRLERDGCDMVGMTALPEAALAREKNISFAICALAVNHAAGKNPGGESIHSELARNVSEGARSLREVLPRVVEDLLRADDSG